MQKEEVEIFEAKSQKDWRRWLEKNHATKQSVWLVFYKKASGITTLNWSQAVDECLCFGWIDSKAKPFDDEKYLQFFSKRKPGGTWSKVNKEKIKQLIADGLMAPAGYESIEKAKQNGSWTILDDVEELVIPADLAKAFKAHKGSEEYYNSLSRSVKKLILSWIVLAKRPETRQKRIDEIAERAGQKLKPGHM